MGLWDDGLKYAGPSLLAVVGTALALPIVLPALAGLARPLTKAAIRLYLEVADDIREVVAHHQPRRGRSPVQLHDLLSGGADEIVTEGLEVEAEESLAETVAEVVVEIL
jgi:hypothetical protein